MGCVNMERVCPAVAAKLFTTSAVPDIRRLTGGVGGLSEGALNENRDIGDILFGTSRTDCLGGGVGDIGDKPIRSLMDSPEGMDVSLPEYAERGESRPYESMRDSPPGDSPQLSLPPTERASPDVRTLKLGGTLRYDRTDDPALVGVRTICRLRVDLSLLTELSEDLRDAVRSISARRCLTTERWSRLRMEGLCARLDADGVYTPILGGVMVGATDGGGVDALRTGGS